MHQVNSLDSLRKQGSWEESLPYARLNIRDVKINFSLPNGKAIFVAENAVNRETEVYSWIEDYLDQESLLLDVGANLGLYSLYAALLKSCRVLAFEPQFASYYILYRNIIMNKMAAKITPYPLAITNSPSMNQQFRLNTYAAGKALNTITQSSSSAEHDKSSVFSDIDALYAHNLGLQSLDERFNFYQPIISTSLDAFLAQQSLDNKPIYLKIDVDGLDFLVLTGALNSLPQIQSIIIEYLPSSISLHKLIPPLLNEYGFTVCKKTDINLILKRDA